MNCDYIIVQAGGRGSRMDYLTENKPKALVPVQNLPILFHLFKKYNNKKFIIIGDYKKDVLKKYLQAFGGVKYLIAETNGKKGTCAGIKEAVEKIPDNKEFMLIWSDLILPEHFELPCETDNYVGLSKDFKCRWSYKNNLFEEIPSADMGVAGFFLFKNKKFLENVPLEGEFVRWLKEEKMLFKTVDLYKTKEYGVIEEYNKLAGSRCRPFNKITVEDDRVIKEGVDEQGKNLAVKEKLWYKKAVELGFKNIPLIFSFEPFVMERINGKNIFEYNLSHNDKKIVINKTVDCLKQLHTLGECETDYFSIYNAYISKTFDRLNKIRDLIPFADDKFININGRKCRNVFFFKEDLTEKFKNYKVEKFKLLHGDCTFSNILLKDDENPVLIDPRGYFGYTELYGDELYDWAKLYYSIKGNYDRFNLRKFRLSIKEREVNLNIESNNWEDIEDCFFELTENLFDKTYLKLVHAVIWLSLTTYAWEDYDSVCGAFYNGLYYLEEVL